MFKDQNLLKLMLKYGHAATYERLVYFLAVNFSTLTTSTQ